MKCEKCDGTGWIPVTETWVVATAKMPPDPMLDADEKSIEIYMAACSAVTERRQGLRNSVYPCKDCRPKVFLRWAEGHFDPDHRTDCEECSSIVRGKPVVKASSAMRGEPEPEVF